jgi:hypothetical protein
MIKIFIILLIAVLGDPAISPAKDCEVLLESISGTYDGDCKKGLAEGTGTAKGVDTYIGEFKKGLPDGQGRYIWKNGDYYSGDFVKGVKEGYGEMKMKREGQKDSLLAGYWIKGIFVGASNLPYRESHSSNIKSVMIEEITENGSEIMIVYARNKQSVVADGLRLVSDQEVKPLSEFEYTVLRKLDFPFTGAKLDFRSQAPGASTILEYHVEFDIFKKARWLITIEVY